MKKYVLVVKDEEALVVRPDTPAGRQLLQQADFVMASYDTYREAVARKREVTA